MAPFHRSVAVGFGYGSGSGAGSIGTGAVACVGVSYLTGITGIGNGGAILAAFGVGLASAGCSCFGITIAGGVSVSAIGLSFWRRFIDAVAADDIDVCQRGLQ